jgi:hypothetical protein
MHRARGPRGYAIARVKGFAACWQQIWGRDRGRVKDTYCYAVPPHKTGRAAFPHPAPTLGVRRLIRKFTITCLSETDTDGPQCNRAGDRSRDSFSFGIDINHVDVA